ncbi:lysylphosphatidylglycerol synthase domain-containing protein [Microbacterium sp. 4R-513]|uniref:lysylphosphatidylglycerol synthase domain-containing protein n=1 Tax=Microbacterium sp. 4R-513 TaxID=2567934 RepID=UPI003218FA38
MAPHRGRPRHPARSAWCRRGVLPLAVPQLGAAGGVVGDVHRAVAHGQQVESVANASRAVAAERTAGQAVQLVLAAVVLASLGVWAYAPAVGVMLLAVLVACAGVVLAAAISRRARAALQRELAHLRSAFAGRGVVVGVVVASAVVVLCHVLTFVVAAVAVGAHASPAGLAAVGLIAVMAGSIPFNLAGWGPREGAAGWAFASVGMGAATGIAASTAYGVLALIAVAPGAAVIAASALRRRRAATVDRARPLVLTAEEPST